MTLNQNPEQIARDNIDKLLLQSGWVIQNKNQINLHIGTGQAVREYQTDTGPADYILFVDGKPVGVIEAKAESHGHKL
jgi:type I restriction enzyme R subunit